MKKFAIITVTVIVVGALSIGALAWRGGGMYGPQQGQGYGPRGGMMNNAPSQGYGPRSGMMYNDQQMPCGGRRGGGMYGQQGQGYGRQFNNGTAPCGAVCPNYGGPQTQPGEAPQAWQMVPEDKVSEVAGEFIAKYFPEYTVSSIEKDDWRPLYFVTIKGANDVEQIMTVHGLNGQVMNIFPKAVEAPEDTE